MEIQKSGEYDTHRKGERMKYRQTDQGCVVRTDRFHHIVAKQLTTKLAMKFLMCIGY